ncbi:MAG TPA: hypothetical protein DIW20_06060, partial [Rhodospirillaceae bacterium]|nr:hypothetical protein [Rhodospirillaceae bacterium]
LSPARPHGIPVPTRGVLPRAGAACPPPASDRARGGIGILKKPKNRAPLFAGEVVSLPRGMGRVSLAAALGVRGSGEKFWWPGYGAGAGRA